MFRKKRKEGEKTETYRYRIYPNQVQKQYIDGHCWACKIVWNWALDCVQFELELFKLRNGKHYLFTNLVAAKKNGEIKKITSALSLIRKRIKINDIQINLLKTTDIDVVRFIEMAELSFKMFLINNYGYDENSVLDINKKVNCVSRLTFVKQLSKKWLNDYSAQAINSVIDKDLKIALSKWMSKQASFPTFKKNPEESYKQDGSFFNQQCGTSNRIVRINDKFGLLTIRKCPDIKIRLHREYSGNLQGVTISKTNTGEYYASLSFDVISQCPNKLSVSIDGIIGIDRGIHHLMIENNGHKFENPRYLKQELENIKFLNRKLEKKRKRNVNWKTSKRYEKLRIRLAKRHKLVSRQREDTTHKATYELTNNMQTNAIAIETLNTKQMMENPDNKKKKISRGMADANFYEIERQLKYKCERTGRTLIKVPVEFPSSQLCSICAFQNVNLRLDERNWKCPSCGTEHDRDINAAINIRKQAILQVGL